MPGHPDWQDYAEWMAAEPVVYTSDALAAGQTRDFGVLDPLLNFKNMLLWLDTDNQPMRLRVFHNADSPGPGIMLDKNAYVNTLDPFLWITSSLSVGNPGLWLSAAAAGLTNFRLYVTGTNLDVQGIYGNFTGPLLSRVADAIAVGATESGDLKPYSGWATIHLGSVISDNIFSLTGRDHNGVELGRVFRYHLQANEEDCFTVWIPPYNMQWAVQHGAGAAGFYSYSITPAWPHP